MFKFYILNYNFIQIYLAKGIGKVREYRAFFPVIWFVSSFSASMLAIILLLLTFPNDQHKLTKYSVFAAQPYVLGESTNKIISDNSRSATLNAVFDYYNCPIAGYGKTFVKYADENNIPYWVVASIAFQESSCGKNTPKINDQNTNNLWGWGVYGDQARVFDSIEQGISVVSRYMANNFYSEGITDLCEIMKTYTPQSKGSWCEGVEYFRDEIVNYETS